MSKSAQHRDTNGFTLIKGCPLSCEGVFQYSAAQVGLPGDPNRIVNVFRPKEAVSDPAAIETFRNLPLINDHEYLSGKYGDEADAAPEDKGVDGVLTANVFWEAPWLRGDLKIFSRSMQKALEDGKKDLSLGFACDFQESPGIWQGTPYEVVQTNLRGNHLALVATGRVPGARVLDGLCFDHLDFTQIPSKEDTNMPKPTKRRAMDEGNPVEELRKLLPQLSSAFDKFLSQEQGETEHQDNPDETTVVLDDDEEERRLAAERANAEVNSTEAEHHDAEAKAEAEKAEAERAATEAAGGDADMESLLAKVEGLVKGIREATGKGATDEAKAADAIEGLQKDKEGAQIVVDEKTLSDISKKAEDAALARFYADAGTKDRIYDRVSKVVGSFDHRAMDSASVYRYGACKLGLKCADQALPVVTATVDAYLDGLDAKVKSTAAKAQDAAEGCPEIEKYLNGGQ